MLLRSLLSLLLIVTLAHAEDAKSTAPGQEAAAAHKASPQADEKVETDLAKQAAKAHADYWAIVKDNEKAGLTHFGQKDIETNPRAKKQVEAQRKYMDLQHEALVEFFSLPARRVSMQSIPDAVRHTDDKDAITFDKAILTYPWENGGDKQLPATAGVMYARRHGIPWLLALCGGAR